MTTSSLSLDPPTLALGSAVLLALALNFKLRPPPPQVHPFLLGRQSLPAPTRTSGQSPVYSSAANGGVRAPYRPDRNVRTLDDVLRKSQTCLEGGERGTWVKGGEGLVSLVDGLRAGLVSKLAGASGSVLVVIDDPTDALLVTLALATSPHKPVVLSPDSSLPEGLHFGAIVKSSERDLDLGDAKFLDLGDAEAAQDLLATGRSLATGAETTKTTATTSDKADVNEVVLTIVSDGIPLALSHQNLTASIVSWLSLFSASPQATKPSLRDTVLSFHHPSTPHGLGLALTVIHQSASLSFPSPPAPTQDLDADSAADAWCALFAPKPAATLIFAPTTVLDGPLYTLVLHKILGDSSLIVRQARDGKLRLLREGTVSKQTFWDSLMWKGLRKDIHLTSLRGLFLSSSPAASTAPLQSHLDTFRISLGCPVVPLLAHPASLAPLATANMWDVQRLPPPGARGELSGDERGHVGAVVGGVEVKLVGSEDDFAAGRMRGELLLRSPALPHPSTLPPHLLSTDPVLPQLPPYPGQAPTDADADAGGSDAEKWFRTGIKAEVSTEGTLWLVESAVQ